MENVLIMALFVASNLLCFVIGAKISQKVQKNEPVGLPELDPLQAYREHQAEKEAKREQDREAIIWQNIENYGTDRPQVDVPGR